MGYRTTKVSYKTGRNSEKTEFLPVFCVEAADSMEMRELDEEIYCLHVIFP